MHAQEIVAVILGGGKGTRLFPLTKDRSKPAVPLAGKYRLVDIPISNCINAGIRKIFVLTMYQSASLNRHIANAYRFDQFSEGFVHILAAEQTAEDQGGWFQGTADAVRKVRRHLENWRTKYALILSGDHLYRMDYLDFAQRHEKSGADLSIAVKPVTREEAPELGVLKIDASGRIVKFLEKPGTEEALDSMATDTTVVGLSPEEAARRPFLASMGIYFFRADTLRELLLKDPKQVDFGKEIIPGAIETHHVQAYGFNDYWADIGTIRAFYEANLDLVAPVPEFNLFDPQRPVYSANRFLPGAKLNRASVEAAVLCEGVIIEGATVKNSILGVRTRVQNGAHLEDCLLMGNDFYQSKGDTPFMGIDEGARLQGAIIDKNACIGKYAMLVNRNGLKTYDDPDGRFFIRDGIIVVPKKGVIPDGFVF